MKPTIRSQSLTVNHADPRADPELRPVATALACLRCQLIGRRRLLCSKADACRALPHVFPLGPVLLGLWLTTALAFLSSIWTR